MPRGSGRTGAIFEPKVPQRTIKRAWARAAIEGALHEGAASVKADFEGTTRNWEHRVVFEVRVDMRAGSAGMTVFTTDEPYRFVNDGTRPHPIYPVRRARLRFQPGYVAHTAPGRLGSGTGGAFGEHVYARAVSHPGTKARLFTALIRKKREREIAERINARLKTEAIRRI